MNQFQQEICTQIKKFRLDKIEPFAEQDDQQSIFRMDVFQEFGKLGFTGMVIPENFGGADLSYQDLCQALTELAKSSVAYAITVSVSTMVQSILNLFGNEEQKSKYLPALCSGQEIGSFALSESSSGSDAAALKTTARKEKGGYRLNGSKLWITSAGIAKTYIVMARTGAEGAKGISAFIVRDGTPGFSYGKVEKKMGWKVSPTRELVFKDCFVPEQNLIDQEGKGFTIAMEALNRGRITVAAIAVGLAQRALEEAVKYSLGRSQFGKPIFDFQGLQFMMADMATEIEAAKALVSNAAILFDSKTPDIRLACMAKLKATDVAMQVTTDAVQILGGVGFTAEYPLERYMRDAKALQIVEGTNQIQKVVIARELKKIFS